MVVCGLMICVYSGVCLRVCGADLWVDLPVWGGLRLKSVVFADLLWWLVLSSLGICGLVVVVLQVCFHGLGSGVADWSLGFWW